MYQYNVRIWFNVNSSCIQTHDTIHNEGNQALSIKTIPQVSTYVHKINYKVNVILLVGNV